MWRLQGVYMKVLKHASQFEHTGAYVRRFCRLGLTPFGS